MTNETTKDGERAAFTDAEIAAFEGLSEEQAKFYFDRRNADGRTHRQMVSDLLAARAASPQSGEKDDERAFRAWRDKFPEICEDERMRSAWNEARAGAPKAIEGYDLKTSTGGRGYLVEYFATRLRRHDFQRFIEERLAADFACVLAQHLKKRDE